MKTQSLRLVYTLDCNTTLVSIPFKFKDLVHHGFEVEFTDGSSLPSKDIDWSAISIDKGLGTYLEEEEIFENDVLSDGLLNLKVIWNPDTLSWVGSIGDRNYPLYAILKESTVTKIGTAHDPMLSGYLKYTPEVVIVTADDWEGFYFDGVLVEEGHTLNQGQDRILWAIEMADKYDFSLKDIQFKELSDKSIETLEERGNFPEEISGLSFREEI